MGFSPGYLLALLAVACGGEADAPLPDASLPDASPPSSDAGPVPYLCVFDYDLTLSSNACPAADGRPELHCRVNMCITYNWYPQCLGLNAREAIAACVERGAYIGIASKSEVDDCWADKVLPILTEQQFPEWTGSPRYASATADWQYPALDDRSHWNCPTCAYTMDGSFNKPEVIGWIMRYYGMDPASPADRARVLFWDDTPGNINDVTAAMPEVTSVLVPRNSASGDDGGCGITTVEIDEGWARVP